MGTGVGSAFLVDRRVVTSGPGVPPLGWITGQKHGDGILNDYLSRPFMMNRYRELTGEQIDIEEMARHAYGGDGAAREIFSEVGRTLGDFLRSRHVEDFKTECIVFGGRISRSLDLFIRPFRERLKGIACLEAILPARDIEYSALRGVAGLVFDRSRKP